MNLRMRWLVRKYGTQLGELPVAALDAHFSAWLAKYEFLQEFDSEHMAFVFVGPAPTSQPFPGSVDAQVKAALHKGMAQAKLDYLFD
jgi:hypothetical protein